jgi:hypothetical protein
MLYILVLASITLILGLFQLFSSIRNHGSILFSLILVIVPLAFVIYSGKSVAHSYHENSKASQTSSKTAKSASLADNKLADIKSESISSSSKAEVAKQVKTNLADSFKSFGDVTYNEETKTYSVVATDADTKKVFKQLIADPSQYTNSNFSDIEKKFTEISKDLKKELGAGYTIQLNQPDSTKAMISYKDGKSTYNMFS